MEKLRWFGFSERLSSAKPIFRRCLIFLPPKEQSYLKKPLKENQSQSLISITRAEIREKFGVMIMDTQSGCLRIMFQRQSFRGKAYFKQELYRPTFFGEKENPKLQKVVFCRGYLSQSMGMTLSAIYSLVSAKSEYRSARRVQRLLFQISLDV